MLDEYLAVAASGEFGDHATGKRMIPQAGNCFLDLSAEAAGGDRVVAPDVCADVAEIGEGGTGPDEPAPRSSLRHRRRRSRGARSLRDPGADRRWRRRARPSPRLR